MNKRGSIFTGVVLAVGGYLAGLLTAPKSGKETRRDLAKKANSAKIETEKKLKVVYSEIQSLISDAEAKGQKLKDRAKEELDDSVKKAKIARDKAKEVLSAVRQGDTEDENLLAALDDLKLAKQNLVKYLKK